MFRRAWRSGARRVLNSWSRSTGVVVSTCGDRLVVLQLGGVVGSRLKRDVAVCDPRQRRRADDCGGAFVQRPVDRDVHLSLSAVGQLDVVNGPDRGTSDQDLVALDQLSAGLEQQAVVVAVAAAGEQEDDDRDRDQDQGADRGRAGEAAASYTGDLRRDAPSSRGHVRPAWRRRCGRVPRASDRVPMAVPSSSSSSPASGSLLSCRVLQLRSDSIQDLRTRVRNWP